MMDSIAIYQEVPIAFDGDYDAQLAEAKRLLCGFFKWESFPDFLEVDVSVEGSGCTETTIELEIYLYHK